MGQNIPFFKNLDINQSHAMKTHRFLSHSGIVLSQLSFVFFFAFCIKWDQESKCCGEILKLDICILKLDINARFFC
jgi:hypothetical protein